MERSMEKKVFGNLLTRLGCDNLSFPHPATDLRVVQTHISLVLLAGAFAYKIKKPVTFPFVDYSTLKRRKDFCQKEVELNRRLAESVYLGVVPLTRKDGQLAVEGTGEPMEYAVKMVRLPEENRVNRFLEREGLPRAFWAKLASRLARFYQEAPGGPKVEQWASFSFIEDDWNQILDQLKSFPSEILEPGLREQLEDLVGQKLKQHQALIEKRVSKAREGHGDLRLEHIYYFPRRPEPGDLAVIDAVEFNPRYRCGDPLLDVAFLAMDLEASGFPRESRAFLGEFLKASGDRDEDHLLDFYIAYRHLVRGLVRGLQAREENLYGPERERARAKASRHFQMALWKLMDPGQRPCLLLLGGLPGAGKSTLSHRLIESQGFQVFSSDAVRKELAGQPPDSNPGAGFEKGIYKPEWTEKTYQALLQRAEGALRRGQRVLVDGSFWRQSLREDFWKLATGREVPFFFIVCLIGHETAEKRLSEARHFGSDADLKIYREMAARWEPPSPELGTLFLNTERPIEVNLSEIHRLLSERGLAVEREPAMKA